MDAWNVNSRQSLKDSETGWRQASSSGLITLLLNPCSVLQATPASACFQAWISSHINPTASSVLQRFLCFACHQRMLTHWKPRYPWKVSIWELLSFGDSEWLNSPRWLEMNLNYDQMAGKNLKGPQEGGVARHKFVQGLMLPGWKGQHHLMKHRKISWPRPSLPRLWQLVSTHCPLRSHSHVTRNDCFV